MTHNQDTTSSVVFKETSLRPIVGQPDFHAIPETLKRYPRWVCWRYERANTKTKWNKPPYNARTSLKADKNNPSDYSNFETALLKFQEPPGRVMYAYNGLGFCLTEDDPFVVLDLDECIDEQSTIAPWAQQFIKQFPGSYWEYSPTDGLHGFISVDKKPNDNYRSHIIDGHKVELLLSRCYCTVTGRRVPSTPNIVADCSEAFHALYTAFPSQAKVQSERDARETRQNVPPDLENEALLTMARASTKIAQSDEAHRQRNEGCSCGAPIGTHTSGELFTDRYKGDNRHNAGNASAGDYNFLKTLAWWTYKNADWMDDIFRKSPRFREKWDEQRYADGRSYGEGIIDAAIATCQGVRPTDAQRGEGVRGGASPDPGQASDHAQEGEESKYFTFLEFNGLRDLPKPQWLIHGMLASKGIAFIYGPPKNAKTYVAVTLASSVATDMLWMGRLTRHGHVIYIAGEDIDDVALRFRGFAEYHGLQDMPNLHIFPCPLALATDTPLLIASLKHHYGDIDIALIIVDTLAICTLGIDESSKKEFDKVIGSTEMLWRTFNCCVALIHHEGKNGEMRGTSNMEAIAMSKIRVFQADNNVVIKSVLIRRGKPFDDIFLDWETIEFPGEYDEMGELLTTSVLVKSEKTAPTAAGTLSPLMQEIMEHLSTMGGYDVARTELMKACLIDRAKEPDFMRATSKLTGMHKITHRTEKQRTYYSLARHITIIDSTGYSKEL